MSFSGSLFAVLAALTLVTATKAEAQRPPAPSEIAGYRGLHAAAQTGAAAEIAALVARNRALLEERDGHGRTPLMVAVHAGRAEAVRALIAAGADLDAREADRYDAVTIAAVAGDAPMVRLLLNAGANSGQITSPYDGTALIASAHAGHVDVVRALIDGKAPLDHVNNLGWTALIEAIVLGDGGARHTQIVRMLVAAGANANIADRDGARPLTLAQRRGYAAIVDILRDAGARP